MTQENARCNTIAPQALIAAAKASGVSDCRQTYQIRRTLSGATGFDSWAQQERATLELPRRRSRSFAIITSALDPDQFSPLLTAVN